MKVSPPSPDPKFEEIRVVRDLVEEAVGVLRYLARDPESVRRRHAELKSFFQDRRRMGQVFLALDGRMTSSEVAQQLGMLRQSVDREIRTLRDAGLVTPTHSSGRASVWVRNPLLEQVLHLSKQVAGWLPELAMNSPEGVAQDDAVEETS